MEILLLKLNINSSQGLRILFVTICISVNDIDIPLLIEFYRVDLFKMLKCIWFEGM